MDGSRRGSLFLPAGPGFFDGLAHILEAPPDAQAQFFEAPPDLPTAFLDLLFGR
jgi:hypothetical protein